MNRGVFVMDIKPKDSKSKNVPGRVVFLSLLSAAVIVMIIAAIYNFFHSKAERILSIGLPLLGIILLFFLPKQQRDAINAQIEKQEKTRIGKFFRFFENILLVGIAVLFIYLFIKWIVER